MRGMDNLVDILAKSRRVSDEINHDFARLYTDSSDVLQTEELIFDAASDVLQTTR
jgi:hypothetical protein